MAHGHTFERVPADEASRDLLDRTSRAPGGYLLALLILLILAVLGLVSLGLKLAGGAEPLEKWGYPAATLAFLLAGAHAAPVFAFATRFAKGQWAVPARRIAELFAVSGIVTTPLFIVLLLQLPTWEGRASIWFDTPGAPLVWDTIAIVLTTATALLFLWLSSIPDLAAKRLRQGKGPGGLALGWTGTPKAWRVLTTGLILVGAFYLMTYAFMHMVLISDLAKSLVPGWHSAVMPVFHGVGGFQAGLCMIVLAITIGRRFGGLARYLPTELYGSIGSIILATSLLFFYFFWSDFLTLWYGRLPSSVDLLTLFVAGPYLGLFLVSFSFNFLLPFALLIWNRIRTTAAGLTTVAVIILIGNFADRLRFYVPAWSLAGPPDIHYLQFIPATMFPNLLDLGIIVGTPSAVLLFYLLALRVIPIVSLWEYKGDLLLRGADQHVRAEVVVVGKPN